MNNDFRTHVVKPTPAIEGAAIELPKREPYALLLCQIKGHMLTYMFKMPEDQMDTVINDWQEMRAQDGIISLDTGIEGVWHIPANEVLFFKRITEGERDAMKRAETQARFAVR